jgi:hypothetical protein
MGLLALKLRQLRYFKAIAEEAHSKQLIPKP